MEIRDLSPDEDVLLLGLLREVVQADGDYTDAERGQVHQLRDALGQERFERAVAEAQSRFASRAALKDAAKEITDQETRERIFEVLERAAASDGLNEREQKPLKWLASWWDIAY
jgi:uncharacterized tellurite resistance protein B-like protein